MPPMPATTAPRRRRALVATAVLAGCAALLSACPAPAEPETGRAVSAGDAYVALGDSYTAAYLTGETDPDSGRCLRSRTNYPSQLAQRLDLDLTDVSCGGATTTEVEEPQLFGDVEVPPQLDAVGEDTDLVTIGLGGNDFNLFGALIVGCVQVAAQDPEGAPCTELVATMPEVEDNFDTIRDRLATVVREVTERAPDARVVLVGYPQAFPRETGCEQLALAAGDVRLAWDSLRKLNNAVSGAAQRSGAEYVDVWTPSAGHDICSTEPWVAGLAPERTDSTPYHPFPEEQALVADLLVDLVTEEVTGERTGGAEKSASP